MKQRVAIARALANQPRILLMDEPFGALDPLTRGELHNELKRLQADLGLTVVLVTHDMTEALLLADRIAVMRDGVILGQGTPRSLLAAPPHAYVRQLLETTRRQADRVEALAGGRP
jgi:osmoprotectant transport system ATP-binding protein